MGFGGEIDVVVAEGPFTDSGILVGFGYDRVTGSYNNHINVGPGTSGPSNGNFTQQVFALNLKIEKFVTERIVFGGGIDALSVRTFGARKMRLGIKYTF